MFRMRYCICLVSLFHLIVVAATDQSSHSHHSLITYTYGALKELHFPKFHSSHRNFSYPFPVPFSNSTLNVSIEQQYKYNSSGVGSAVWDGSDVSKFKAKERASRMEHCSYRLSDFYLVITLLMSSIESHLSNKPKQVFFNPINIFDTFTRSITLL